MIMVHLKITVLLWPLNQINFHSSLKTLGLLKAFCLRKVHYLKRRYFRLLATSTWLWLYLMFVNFGNALDSNMATEHFPFLKRVLNYSVEFMQAIICFELISRNIWKQSVKTYYISLYLLKTKWLSI